MQFHVEIHGQSLEPVWAPFFCGAVCKVKLNKNQTKQKPSTWMVHSFETCLKWHLLLAPLTWCQARLPTPTAFQLYIAVTRLPCAKHESAQTLCKTSFPLESGAVHFWSARGMMKPKRGATYGFVSKSGEPPQLFLSVTHKTNQRGSSLNLLVLNGKTESPRKQPSIQLVVSI